MWPLPVRPSASSPVPPPALHAALATLVSQFLKHPTLLISLGLCMCPSLRLEHSCLANYYLFICHLFFVFTYLCFYWIDWSDISGNTASMSLAQGRLPSSTQSKPSLRPNLSYEHGSFRHCTIVMNGDRFTYIFIFHLLSLDCELGM